MLDKHGLLTQPISDVLRKLTTPMVFGMVAILLFNLVDTFFISLLGTDALAAVSFTFPVTFAVNCITMGIGVGLSASIGHLLGEGHSKHAAELTTHGLILAISLILIACVLGFFTIDPLFTLLGAEDKLLPLIDEYMSIWYLTIPLLVIPMSSNSAIRATGDTKTPAKIMMLAGLINGILDPLLIFGYGPFPELGIQGAAIASAISWFGALIASFYVLTHKVKLLALPNKNTLISDWKQILTIGSPAALSNALNPISGAILMMMLASQGTVAVASYGAAQRVESLMLLVIMALTSSLSPLVAQNLGAKQPERVKEAIFLAIKFSVAFQLFLYILIVPLSIPISHLFSQDDAVQHGLWMYLICVPFSYGFQGIVMVLVSSLNAMKKPLYSFSWSFMRLFVFTLPTAWIGSQIYGMEGLFIGIAMGNVMGGISAFWYARTRIRFEDAAFEERGKAKS
ncbi:MATE family efflux transporter [Aliivibrio fischeri]|uniref:MATE family efflux transporter n=1 Tax=Aliivibrio fischeri TaxID=668 RepID=UPI0012DA847A|nr:MATE family efflux transporter [Aliivibrio fischeri]MUL09211.1 MATE family efflux transporter [Aliivibrio fischeri]MUL15057.1 MATE family efflux transporter [Aliivibrio fischeri]